MTYDDFHSQKNLGKSGGGGEISGRMFHLSRTTNQISPGSISAITEVMRKTLLLVVSSFFFLSLEMDRSSNSEAFIRI